MFLAPVSVHLLLVKQGRILLLRRYNTGYEDGNYSVVAGHIEGGEELKTAMIREATEEASIEILPSDLEVVGVIHSVTDGEYLHFFLKASEWMGEVTNMEPDKCDDLSWFDISDLPDNTIPYIRQGIENCRRGEWFPASVGLEPLWLLLLSESLILLPKTARLFIEQPPVSSTPISTQGSRCRFATSTGPAPRRGL